MSDADADPGMLTAWQRWEMASFDPPAPVGLPTAQEIERMVAQAHQEGFNAGYQDGQRAAQAEAAQLAAVHTALTTAMAALPAAIEPELVRLALAMTRQMVRAALEVRPELVLSLLQEALASLPLPAGQVRVFLHPDDAALVRRQLADAVSAGGWQLIDAPDMTRGGCRIETAVNQIDATLETRWRTLLAAFAEAGGWNDA